MSGFIDALLADGPAGPGLDLFGRLVGTWSVRNRLRPEPDAPWAESERIWIFAWVVGGRAIQDVLIGSDRDASGAIGGTTIRAYDPVIDAWRIEWLGPLHGNYVSLIARPHSPDGIRQDGLEHRPDGDVPVRWNFSAITESSFAWDGWASADGGRTWWLEQHMDAERIQSGLGT